MPPKSQIINEVLPIIEQQIKKLLPIIGHQVKKLQPIIEEQIRKMEPVIKEQVRKMQPIIKEQAKKLQPIIEAQMRKQMKKVQPALEEQMKKVQPLFQQVLNVFPKTEARSLLPGESTADGKHAIKINMKGFKPEEIKVKVEQDKVIIEGRHNERNVNKDNEFSESQMSRHFMTEFKLPPGTNPNEVQSNIGDGFVTILTSKKK